MLAMLVVNKSSSRVATNGALRVEISRNEGRKPRTIENI